MVVARRPRRRRRLLALLAVGVTVVAVVSTVAGGSGRRDRARRAWLDGVRPVVERSNELGAEVADLRGRVATLDRPTLSRRLARMAAEARAIRADAAAVGHPGALDTARSLLVAALAVRERAVAALRPAFDAALGAGPTPQAAAALAAVGADLVVADRDYELFVAALPAADRAAAIPSRWIADPAPWQRPELDAFVATLRSSASLIPVHDLAVVSITTDPPAVGREGDADVLPAVRTLRVQVVVANVGNERERRVPVVATVTLPDGSRDTARQFVDLDAGQRLVVRLGGLRVATGAPVSLVVTAGPLPLESNPADNEVRRTLVLR
jgi:hypothetical protein